MSTPTNLQVRVWHIASFRCTAPVRQQLGVKQTCHGHGWIDAIDPNRTLPSVDLSGFDQNPTTGSPLRIAQEPPVVSSAPLRLRTFAFPSNYFVIPASPAIRKD